MDSLRFVLFGPLRVRFAVQNKTLCPYPQVELEAHELKKIFFFYPMSYLCLKSYVQRKVQRTRQSQHQELMHYKSMKNAETPQISLFQIWNLSNFGSNFALTFETGQMLISTFFCTNLSWYANK